MPLPPLADSPVPGSVVDVPVTFPPLTGRTSGSPFDTVRLENTLNYYSQTPIAMPLGIADGGHPRARRPPRCPADVPTSCRGDLLTVDGAPVWVEVTATTAAALDRQALTVSLCGPDAGGLALGPGRPHPGVGPGQIAGFDIDQLALDSAPGGGAMPLAGPTTLARRRSPPPRRSTSTARRPPSSHLTVDGVATAAGTTPFDLVLGETINTGWTATVDGGRTLGPAGPDRRLRQRLAGRPGRPGAATSTTGRLDVTLVGPRRRGWTWPWSSRPLAIVACLVLAFCPPTAPAAPAGRADRGRRHGGRLRRPRRRRPSTEAARPPPTVARSAPRAHGPPWPSRSSPAWWPVAWPPPSPRPAAGVAVGAATLLVAPGAPVCAFLLAMAAVGVRGRRPAYVAVHQATSSLVPDNGAWPQSFGTASQWAWAGVVFLGADGPVDVALAGAGRRPGPDSGVERAIRGRRPRRDRSTPVDQSGRASASAPRAARAPRAVASQVNRAACSRAPCPSRLRSTSSRSTASRPGDHLVA